MAVCRQLLLSCDTWSTTNDQAPKLSSELQDAVRKQVRVACTCTVLCSQRSVSGGLQLDNGILAHYKSTLPSRSEQHLRERAFDDVAKVVVKRIKGAELHLFGSSAR